MSKKSFIDGVRVKDACTENWDEMVGSEGVRFCSHCSKHVNNISTMTRKEATRLVRDSDGRLCIRYIKDPATNAPLFKEQLIQISRRVPTMAVGAMAASLSLSAMTYAQGSAERPPLTLTDLQGAKAATTESSKTKKTVEDEPRSNDLGSLTGMVKDQMDARVAGAAVTLTSADGTSIHWAAADGGGVYTFPSLPAGTYTLEISAPGFSVSRQSVTISDGVKRTVDAVLNVGAIMGDIIVIDPQRAYTRPFAAAVESDDVESVRKMIAGGANVNERQTDKSTPIFFAVENGNIEMVRMLLEFGAKVNVRDSDKRTPLMQLDEDTSPELIQLLVTYGAKVNLSDKRGNTALILAAEEASPAVVQALIDAGADANLINKEGQSALMNAANDDSLEKVRILLLAHANVNLRNKEGDSAWDLTSDEEIEKLLVSFGAEVDDDDEQDDEGLPAKP